MGLGRIFSFLTFYTVGRNPPTDRTAQTQIKRKRTSMPQVGFETTIPVFEGAKTVHALDHAATVTGKSHV
jgi:hypothetical protein